jgi:hypothetical protein
VCSIRADSSQSLRAVEDTAASALILSTRLILHRDVDAVDDVVCLQKEGRADVAGFHKIAADGLLCWLSLIVLCLY